MRSSLTLNSKATVSSKGQIVIPKEIRLALGIHSGTELLFKIKEDGALEARPVRRSIEMFFGKLKQAKRTALSGEAMDKAIIEAVLANDQQRNKQN